MVLLCTQSSHKEAPAWAVLRAVNHNFTTMLETNTI